MSWVEVNLSVNRDQAEAAELALEQAGALAITFEDQADHPVLEPALGTTPLWPVMKVRGLFSFEADKPGILAALLDPGVIDRPDAISWNEVADQDWERAWMDRFEPMQFGRKLWIVPTGMQGPGDPDSVQLKLDPGLAFGTGTHPTTALCLEWIDSQDFAGKNVLDFGCGSGVLGIAAALKGAASVCCIDNDPQALLATRDNAERNDVSAMIQTALPEDWPGGQYQVVLANILAGPLIELAPLLSVRMDNGADIVLSGVLAHQSDEVARAYRESCGEMHKTLREDWVRLHGNRNGV